METSYRDASWCSVLSNCYQSKLLRSIKNGSDLKFDNLFRMKVDEEVPVLLKSLSHQWIQEKKKPRPSLVRALCRSFGCSFVAISLFAALAATIPAFYLILVKTYISSLYNQHEGIPTSVVFLCLIFLLCFLNIFIQSSSAFQAFKFGIIIRKALTGLLYQKLLKLPVSQLTKASPGRLINLASGDMTLIQTGSWNLSGLIYGPVSSLATIFLLYQLVRNFFNQIGELTLYCLAVVAALFCIQLPWSRIIIIMRLKVSQETDRRLNFVNTLILGIQTIKNQVWEENIIERVKEARKKEYREYQKMWCVKGFGRGFFFISRFLCSIPIILVLLAQGKLLQAAIVFPAITMADQIGQKSVSSLSRAVSSMSEYLSVIKRIQEVLLMDQIQESKRLEYEQSSLKVEMSNLSASWMSYQGKNQDSSSQSILKFKDEEDISLLEREYQPKSVIEGITLTLEVGKVLAVVGKVGSGKSSLIATIMHETHIISGYLKVNGRVAYVEQEPTIFSDSVRNNILFGLPLDEQRLTEVIRVCQLQQDLEQLVNGLDTQIGERGVNVSGGQKARISLARACYSQADIYLLDDPLSAVDSRVAKNIFQDCIRGYLESKTVLLVTHQIAFLEGVDEILVLERGNCSFQGTFSEFRSHYQGLILSALVKDEEEKQGSENKKDQRKQQEEEEKRLILLEEKAEGIVGWKVCSKYLRLYPGMCCNLLFLLIPIAPYVMFAQVRFIVSDWVSVSNTSQITSLMKANFVMISVGALILSGLTTILITFTLLNLSNRLHNSMLSRISRAPMSFFTSNPLGRIINRFSKDTAMADSALNETFSYFLQVSSFLIQLFYYFICFVAITVIVYPYLIIVVALISLYVVYLVRSYSRAIIDSLRFDAMSRSPVNSFFAASLYSLITIRAFRREKEMEQKFNTLVQQNGRAYFTYLALSRWLGFTVQLGSSLFILAILIFAQVLSHSTKWDQAQLSLAITSTLSVFQNFQYIVRLTVDISSSMASIQRMQEYTEIPQEPAALLPSDQLLPQKWPTQGSITFQGVNLRYRENFELVLKNLSFKVEPGMKVGIVGRTGAGKSSLLQALFRLVECDEGASIFIDNVDISQIGLSTLRSAISIIPQTPVIFEGTVRDNLDPFSVYSDEAIWNALENVELKQTVLSFEKQLLQYIEDSSSVFSVGQKQLICLARAILRKNKILVMDEATANVDMHTDALIQTSIKEKFKECTILTIAHRIDTVIDYDRILVMKKGEVVEYGHPYELLEKEEGEFRRMVAARGKASEIEMRERAKACNIEMGKHLS